MSSIPTTLLKVGGAVLAAGAGIGAVTLASRLTAEAPDRRQLVNGLLAGAGGVAVVGAVLARNTNAFGPLLGAGIGLAGAGIVDAVLAGREPVDPRVKRLAQLTPGSILPDGVQAAPRTVVREGDQLRFDSVIGNQGAAPLQIALRYQLATGPSRTTQVFYNEDGTVSELEMQSGLRVDPRRDHSHLHFDDFVYFQLYKADKDGNADMAAGEVTGGVKQSFYITDIQSFSVADPKNLELAGKLANKGRVDRDIVPGSKATHGISVGMADVYSSYLEGQSLPIAGVAPGRYVLRQTFDPSDELIEQDERNNAADTLIEIAADGKVTTVRSQFAPQSAYETRPDGRIVIPGVKDSLDKLRTDHGPGNHSH